MNPKRPLDSVALVVPVYNEGPIIEAFHQRLIEVMVGTGFPFRIYYVNDGSTDGTERILLGLSEKDTRVIAVHLSRNFGHQAALTAGMDLAEGDVMVSLDGDGQHPPEIIPEMLGLFQSGYDIVITHRLETTQVSFFKRWTARAFYSLINWLGDTHISPGSSDFRLLSRVALDALKQMPEYHRFLRGMVSGWVSVL
jgi:dolichol-phosphate mannosyltransferase